MKIIAISREFGSGGRELGKRLADALSIPCYDKEIIEMVAEKKGLDKNYVAHMSEKDIRMYYPATIGRSFYMPIFSMTQAMQVAATEHQLIQELALRGDCLIVGRCADVILKEMKPMRLFVYADEDSKLKRCRERAEEDESLSDKELVRKIKEVDRGRIAYRKSYTDSKWGECKDYDLCINTSDKEIKLLIPGLVAYVKGWFDSRVG